MYDWLTLKWTTLLTRGLIGIAFGVLAMAWPDVTVAVLVVLWGFWALLDGAVTLSVVGRVPGTGARVLAIVAGVVALLVGFFALLKPGIAAATLTWFLGAWLLVRGVVEVVQAFGGEETTARWALVLGGLVDGLIGALFLANPGKAVLGIAWVLGLLALVWGVALVVLAFVVRRSAGRTDPDRPMPAYG